MKLFKIILGIVIVLAVAVGILSFVLPKEMTMERSVVINKPVDEVFAYVRSAEKSKEWSPWFKMDPNMKITTTGTDGEVGFIFAWEGNKDVGVGEQEWVKVAPNERIDFNLRFKEPMEGDAKAWFVTTAEGENQTRVTWGMHSISKPPFNVICWIMNMGGMMDKVFDQGLADMKAALEVPRVAN